MTVLRGRWRGRLGLLSTVGALAFIAAPASAQTAPAAGALAEAQARIDDLQRQVEALQQAVAEMRGGMAQPAGGSASESPPTPSPEAEPAVPSVSPSWSGAPEFEDEESGSSFKPKGFLQFDAGYVGYPDGNERRGTVSGLNYQNLGFNTRARRIVLGVEGGLPGGFEYNADFNFAQGDVDYEDLTLTYDFDDGPLSLTIGNFYPYYSLETMTSSRLGSMLERASFTDAFNYNRRLGMGLSLADEDDRAILSAGIFSTPINDGLFTRTGWEAAARGTYSPRVGNGFVHLGASAHYRRNNRESQAQQYRSRPLTQVTDQRFVDTGNLASKGDVSAGVELGGAFESLHFASELQKLWVRHAYSPAELLLVNANPDSNRTVPGNATGLEGDPSFTGGYVELGYYLTGETRGYSGGRWGRTRVLNPFNRGGWGAFQVNGRFDYLDLSDRVDGSSSSVAAPVFVNGGKQLGYQVSLIWNPIDYVRFLAQYGRVGVTGGPRAAAAVPDSTEPLNRRDYSVDTAAVRAQVDF